MSQRPNRHQRRPSQSLFMSPDFLLSEDAVVGDKVVAAAAAAGAPTNQAAPSQLISPPLPPSAEAAKTGPENLTKENKKTTTDVAN